MEICILESNNRAFPGYSGEAHNNKRMNISKNIQGYPVKCAGVRKNKRINPVCMMCDIFDIKKYYTKSTWRISGINQCIMNRMR